jgi:4-amino-4-deoxy-L-arabinose transferase-like glycosyltransferase
MMSAPKPGGWVPLILLLVVLAVLAALRATIASMPLDRDEGEYAYIAQRWLAGVPPYKESFDQKPPGTFAFYALTFVTLGTSTEAIHWAGQLYTFGTLGCLFLIGRKLGDAWVGVLAALYGGFAAVECSLEGNALNTETVMILPLTAAFLVTLHAVETGRASWQLAAGALSSVAVLCKQPALFNLVYHWLLLTICFGFRPRAGMVFLAGAALPIALVTGYFAACGALSEFWDCTVAHNLYYSASLPLREYPEHLDRALFTTESAGLPPLSLTLGPVFSLAFVGLFTGLRPRANLAAGLPPHHRLWLAGWLFFSLAGASVGGYFRHHYFIQIMPAVSLLAALGTRSLTCWLPLDLRGLTTAAVAGLSVLWGVAYAWEFYVPFKNEEQLVRESKRYYPVTFSESATVARYLVEHTTPDEPIYIFGSEPQVYFYARRTSASRYIFVYPLMTAFADTAARQQQVIRELELKRPRYVVTVPIATSFLRQPDAPRELDDYVECLLAQRYRLVAAVDSWAEGTDTRLVSEEGTPERWHSLMTDVLRNNRCSFFIWRRASDG